MISSKFIRSSFIYTLAGALPMASAIILLPLYIAYLPTEAYGALSLCLAFSIFIQIVVTYSFDTTLYVYFHEFKTDFSRLASLVSAVFIFMLLLGTGLAIFFLITGEFLFSTIFSLDSLSFYPYGMMAVGIGIFQAIFKVHGNLLQTREKPETFFWSNAASFTTIAITTVIGLKLFPGSLVGPLGGRLLAAFLSAAWTLFRVFREFGFHPQSPWKLTSSAFNALTFVYQLQQWVINYLDRFLILYFMPLSVVGIYDFALKCIVPIELLLNGLNASISPKVVNLISGQSTKTSTPEINRYFYAVVSLILLAICLTIIGMPVVLDWFVEKSGYAESIQYIPYLALLYIFRAVRLYFVLPYTILKKMKGITLINLGVSVIKILLMVWLIDRWQLYGVIISAAVSFLIEILLLWNDLNEHYPIRFNFFKLMGVPIFMFAVILLVESQLDTDYTLLVHVMYGLLCTLLLATAYRNELKLLDPLKMLRR